MATLRILHYYYYHLAGEIYVLPLWDVNWYLFSSHYQAVGFQTKPEVHHWCIPDVSVLSFSSLFLLFVVIVIILSSRTEPFLVVVVVVGSRRTR